ncbi:MAG: YesL family protein [Lachnospiraceae bacterium]
MGSLFDQDRAFWRFINKTADLVILNVVFILCCVPIVTIGPAYTALYYTVMKTIKKDRGYAMRNFFHSFKQNLLQGAVIWMILLVLGTACGMVLYMFWDASAAGGSAQWIFWITAVIAFFIICLLLYIFPVLSRFDFKLPQFFAFSYLIAVRYFVYTLLLVLLFAAFLLAGYFCIPAAIIILPALYAFISSFLIERIFAVYMPKFEAPAASEHEENDDDVLLSASDENNESATTGEPYKDQWYYD